MNLDILSSDVLQLHNLSWKKASRMLLTALRPCLFRTAEMAVGRMEGSKFTDTCGSCEITLISAGLWCFSSERASQTSAERKDTRRAQCCPSLCAWTGSSWKLGKELRMRQIFREALRLKIGWFFLFHLFQPWFPLLWCCCWSQFTQGRNYCSWHTVCCLSNMNPVLYRLYLCLLLS